jgi:outer membrane protein assembly factor BamA
MKKILTSALLVFIAVSINSQEAKTKSGWKLGGAFPAISFDSNLGFQYGFLFDLFNYGNPSIFPKYYDHTYTEISRYTKGSGVYRFMYESTHIIPGIELISDLSYLPDQADHFYGFNGYESVFNKDWTDDESSSYKSEMFYRYQRNLFRFRNDFLGKLSGKHLKWSAGFSVQNFKISSVNVDKLKNAILPGLFELYRDSLGLIPQDEAKGGWVNTLKAGIVWDSRDYLANPMKGIWTELGLEIAPKFLGNDWSFARFYITHRQYFTLVEKNLSLAYRVVFQSTISGKVPYFYEPLVNTYRLTGYSSEGLGGVSTMRGILKNRIVGDGFILGNVELRWKPVYFKLLKRDSYLGLNLFYDVGMVTRDIPLPNNLRQIFNSNMKEYNYNDFFTAGGDELHHCAGISIMPVWGENFVLAIDIGKAFNAQDGNIGFSFGLNYLF